MNHATETNISNALALASSKTAGFDELRGAVLLLTSELQKLMDEIEWSQWRQAKQAEQERDRQDAEMAEYYARTEQV